MATPELQYSLAIDIQQQTDSDIQQKQIIWNVRLLINRLLISQTLKFTPGQPSSLHPHQTKKKNKRKKQKHLWNKKKNPPQTNFQLPEIVSDLKVRLQQLSCEMHEKRRHINHCLFPISSIFSPINWSQEFLREQVLQHRLWES